MPQPELPEGASSNLEKLGSGTLPAATIYLMIKYFASFIDEAPTVIKALAVMLIMAQGALAILQFILKAIIWMFGIETIP